MRASHTCVLLYCIVHTQRCMTSRLPDHCESACSSVHARVFSEAGERVPDRSPPVAREKSYDRMSVGGSGLIGHGHSVRVGKAWSRRC